MAVDLCYMIKLVFAIDKVSDSKHPPAQWLAKAYRSTKPVEESPNRLITPTDAHSFFQVIPTNPTTRLDKPPDQLKYNGETEMAMLKQRLYGYGKFLPAAATLISQPSWCRVNIGAGAIWTIDTIRPAEIV